MFNSILHADRSNKWTSHHVTEVVYSRRWWNTCEVLPWPMTARKNVATNTLKTTFGPTSEISEYSPKWYSTRWWNTCEVLLDLWLRERMWRQTNITQFENNSWSNQWNKSFKKVTEHTCRWSQALRASEINDFHPIGSNAQINLVFICICFNHMCQGRSTLHHSSLCQWN